ncbi:hypothetical protein [Mycoplasmopsis alligatoris]|uniref:Lipoprotein n=1 Tax=Mycoplasmopsis alligatoris A21JP2 TaxID=747682 RepID=D4XWF6_9BACT|nr:hypothetical protein [Mycoplasmopsis alligatoris]EFF41241.1 hypothetical protein MALL_0474 [Mycoplasmopsis alligatoris A21JP2]
MKKHNKIIFNLTISTFTLLPVILSSCSKATTDTLKKSDVETSKSPINNKTNESITINKEPMTTSSDTNDNKEFLELTENTMNKNNKEKEVTKISQEVLNFKNKHSYIINLKNSEIALEHKNLITKVDSDYLLLKNEDKLQLKNEYSKITNVKNALSTILNKKIEKEELLKTEIKNWSTFIIKIDNKSRFLSLKNASSHFINYLDKVLKGKQIFNDLNDYDNLLETSKKYLNQFIQEEKKLSLTEVTVDESKTDFKLILKSEKVVNLKNKIQEAIKKNPVFNELDKRLNEALTKYTKILDEVSDKSKIADIHNAFNNELEGIENGFRSFSELPSNK